ncbi:MAG: hypothetical protein PVH87_19385 [Desulfobacteraceae bacterium]
MRKIPIILKNVNIEVMTKLLNSVAKRYGCHVEYIAEDNRIQFKGDISCCRHVTEEVLAFFPKTTEKSSLPFNCPIDEKHNGLKSIQPARKRYKKCFR